MGTWEGVDPRLFNFVSDISSVFIQKCISIAIAYAFSLFMSLHLSNRPNQNHIPLDLLGSVPGDAVEAACFLARLLSFPTFGLFVLLLVADFSHSFADLGLDFVTVQEPGKQDTVLSLQYKDRNSQRLLQTTGDPLSARTVPRFDIDTNLVESNFLAAADGIARGNSPFLDRSAFDSRSVTWNGASYRSIFLDDDSPLVSVDLFIPLNCSSDEMVLVPQIIETSPLLDPTVRSTALVPNCTLTSVRGTGIHSSATQEYRVETNELAFSDLIFRHSQVDTFLTWSGDGTELLDFNITTPMQKLARDRKDWKKGRRIDGIFDGIRVGSLQIDLGAIVLATGPARTSLIGSASRNTYMLIAEIKGECPERPSGLTSTDTSCIAFVRLECDSFVEDFRFGYVSEESSSECSTEEMAIIWGRHFLADEEFVAVVAGLYGRTQPNQFEFISELRYFTCVAQAAAFVLGTLRSLPSVEENVAPSANAVYYTFMALPLVAAGIMFLWVNNKRGKDLGIPVDVWQLMVLAQEQETIPPRVEREKANNEFPEQNTTLALTLSRDGLIVKSAAEHVMSSSVYRSLTHKLSTTLLENRKERTSVSQRESSSVHSQGAAQVSATRTGDVQEFAPERTPSQSNCPALDPPADKEMFSQTSVCAELGEGR